MATIGNLTNGYTTSSSTSKLQSELKDVQEQMKKTSKDTSISSSERSKLQKEQKEQIKALQSQISESKSEGLAGVQTQNSNLVTSMFGGGVAGTQGQTGFDFFFGANATMTNVMTLNKARSSIESRARTLTSEIAMDKKRGLDTSGKEEKLANLTANVDMMDKSLVNDVNKVFESNSSKKKYDSDESVIGNINKQLEANQKKLEAEFQEIQDKKEAEKPTNE